MWLVKWDENRVEDSGHTAKTLALAFSRAKSMDEHFCRGTKRADGSYHDYRTGITITEVIAEDERYTVVYRGMKACQYADRAAAEKHAIAIGGTVVVAKHNPERIVEVNHGSYYRKAGVQQAECSRKMAKQKATVTTCSPVSDHKSEQGVTEIGTNRCCLCNEELDAKGEAFCEGCESEKRWSK